MKILIIYAHPDIKGHSSTYLHGVTKGLQEKEIDYEVIDLYKINYDPILHAHEHYTTGNREITKQNLEFQQKINESQKLIFIYPIWWGSMPAILKGFIDRVFVPGFAFRKENGKYIKLLKGKAVVLTAMGMPKALYYMMMKMPTTLMKMGVLNFCGLKSKVFTVHNTDELSQNNIKTISENVKNAVTYLTK